MNTTNCVQPDFIMCGGARMNFIWGPADNLQMEAYIDMELGRLEHAGIACKIKKFGGKKYLYRSIRGWACDDTEDKPKKNVHSPAWRSLMNECKRGHPLSGENVRIEKSGKRTCLTCERFRDAEKYNKKKSLEAQTV